MSKAISLRELKRHVSYEGSQKAARHLVRGLDEGFSVKELFEGLHEDGGELLRNIGRGKSGGQNLLEAANAVDTSAFTGIIGQIVFNRVKEAYSDPEFLWPQ